MCCFSQPVLYVGSTSIYGRLDGERQWLAYQMEVETVDEVAMVLPLPVPSGAAEDAVRFHDLSAYPELFLHLERAWPPRDASVSRGGSLGVDVAGARTLQVHAVGEFDASFVPAPSAFGRLDPRFQLGDAVLSQLPQYADWGFAVFQLRQERPGFFARLFGAKGYRRQVHPMALSFPTRRPDAVFFPTVHVHDGEAHPEAHFDHTLYAQGASVGEGWVGNAAPVAEQVDLRRAGGLVTDGPAVRHTMTGLLVNEDVWLVA